MAKDLTAAWAALSEGVGASSRQDTRLPAAPTLPAIPGRSGSAGPNANKSSSGIASPLVETAYATRTWHAERTITSPDGLFALRVKYIEKINFLDANNNPVQIQYKAPT